MPIAAMTYDIKSGYEDEVAEVFSNFTRPPSADIPSAEGKPTSRILATAVFIRDNLLVRVIEFEGDIDDVARYMAVQPGVQEVERKLKPYLNTPRDTATVEGFVATVRQNTLRCVTHLAVPRYSRIPR